MGDKLRQKDGLSRQQRIEEIKVADELKLMDDRLYSLGQKLSGFYHFINYYDLQNNKKGTFDKLIKSTVFLITADIREYNIEKEEKDFLKLLGNNYYTRAKKEELILNKIIGLITLFESWLSVTSFFTVHDYELTLHSDLINQVVVNLKKTTSLLFSYISKNFTNLSFPLLSSLWGIEKVPLFIDDTDKFFKSSFYKYFNSIQFLQKNVNLYEKEVFTSGYNDPSIAIMIAFLRNHSTVLRNFNQRWQDYSKFYFDKILKAQQARAIPDSTILQIKKDSDKDWLEITPGTPFIAGEKTRLLTTEPLWVNNIELKSVLGLYEEEDEIIEPASWLGHVTALKKVDLSSLIDVPAVGSVGHAIFEKKGKKSGENTPSMAENTSVGLMVRSWSLWLNEGVRNITLKLILTSDSVISYQNLISNICNKWGEVENNVIYKLLNDIFYIKITTSEGWFNIESYSAQFVIDCDNPALEINFSVNESFPPICPLEFESKTPPAIQLLLNRNAWLFPYSWLKDFEFKAMKIITEVSGLSNIQLFSELGKLDTTMPFHPFGMLPSRGAWLVFGCHEMAVKRIKSLDLKIKWANLPSESYGFADYYLEYQKDIDNCSFIVEPQVLKNRKWVSTSGKKGYYLFNTDIGDQTLTTIPKAPLSSESFLSGITPDDFVRQKFTPDDFTYNMFASNGFFRLKLTNPEIGFGHQQYHRILSDVLMQNARTKKFVKAPNPPFAPQAEFITINYISEDEISVMHPSEGFGEALYHLYPFGEYFLNIFATRKSFRGIPDFESRGNLLFGFNNVKGGENIKLYFSLVPQKKEIDRSEFPQIIWFYGDGYHWSLIPQNQIIKDETLNLLESGVIEFKIPHQIPEKEASLKNLFWLRAAIMLNVENLSEIKGFYLHVVKVERKITNDQESLIGLNTLSSGQIGLPEQRIPGLSSVVQLSQSSGGKIAEDEITMRVRISERISHRNRAVNAKDFEKIILENFTSIRKVKCFPCLDTKQNRPGVVTIAIIPETEGLVRAPMANCKLLIDVEDFIKNYTNMFATVDAINPGYEFLQVRCKVTLNPTRTEGYYLRLLSHEINNYIAYWEVTGDAPVFGRSISLIDLANFIRSREYVMRIRNFSVLHLREKEELLYELVETGEFEKADINDSDLRTNIKILLNNREIKIKELKPIAPSKPWSIIIPMEKHLLVAEWEDQVKKAGISELEIGNTFVIS